MKKEMIGNVRLYDRTDSEQQAPDEDDRLLQEIVHGYGEEDYHDQITAHKNWTAMYQLAESRANIVEWLELPEHAKVLELGAGCGTITSALLKKGACVTCQEEDPHYCRLNAWRHQNADGLAIYAMPFDECGPQLDQDYDVILSIDVPIVEGEAEQLLRQIRRHLKPDGLLVLAAKNKFGMKYWAGNKEAYTHKYFAGLENAGVRLYSGSRLKKLLYETGFERQEFYYPYPDERFALDIYSDRYLPQKGDLTYNIVNYEDDRILLFDEQKVFDSVIEEGQFPFFSNAYLCLAGAHQIAVQGQTAVLEEQAAECRKEREAVLEKHVSERGKLQEVVSEEHAAECRKRQEVVYVRYASDRSKEHAVCTEITDTSVRKRAMYPQGEAHVAHILEAYQRLSRQYGDTDLRFNRCESRRGADGKAYAEFELLHARALQEQVEQAAAAGDMKKIFDILRRMMQYIRSGSKTIPFSMTDDFKKVFGTIPDPEVLAQTVCSEISDIDLILPNILEGDDGTWHVIDYEWTFFFPVPQNFIIYRTLFFLNHENPQREELSMEHLLKIADITSEEAEAYARMEEAFQRYVTGGLVPYREMVNLLERRFIDIVKLEADYERVLAQNEMLKGQGIWKAARKIKKKLTGN